MERKKYLDVAKGIGVILVVLGHLVTYEGAISKWIFSFHMPLFFFCSGMVFKEQKDFIDLLKRSLKKNLKPYVVFLMIGIVITFIIPDWRNGFDSSIALKELRRGQPECFHVGQIWFLMCLFWVEILFGIIYSCTKKSRILNT